MPQSFITIRVCLIKTNLVTQYVHLEHEWPGYVVLRTGLWQCQPSPGWSSPSSLVWRSPFLVTLQRIFNTCLKKLSLVVFCCNFWTLQQKPHDYICSGCKNMVSQKCAVLIGPPGTDPATDLKIFKWKKNAEFTERISADFHQNNTSFNQTKVFLKKSNGIAWAQCI